MTRHARGRVMVVYLAVLAMLIWTLFPFAVAFSTALRRDSEVTLIPGRWIPPIRAWDPSHRSGAWFLCSTIS